MKKTLLALMIGLFCLTSFSADTKIVDYRFGLELTHPDTGIKEPFIVKLEIKKSSIFDLGDNMLHSRIMIKEDSREKWNKEIHLQAEDFLTWKDVEKVFFYLKELKLVKIETIDRDLVCKMMPPPETLFNHLYISKGVLKLEEEYDQTILVSGPTGCWEKEIIRPIERFDQIAAEELKSFLKEKAKLSLQKGP